MNDNPKIRVRFAPSPTGPLHIGGLRTALYNFLLARQIGGTMILRIEDTDQSRFVPGAEEYILESLQWAGIQIDEGVGVGGPYAPYKQSERKSIYSRYAHELIDSGLAYYAFDTEEDLAKMRGRLKASGADHQQYGSDTRMSMRNSLTLGPGETKKLIESNAPHVIRMMVQPKQEVIVDDVIRGKVTVNTSQIDDKVLVKSDGMPTYHLANVVDDYLMKISHVIRGEEWLPSAPLHVLLYKYFGWESDMPRFVHLPLLLKPSGEGKLSKRDADQMGFPIFPLDWKDRGSGEFAKGFRETGYLPEAVINFLAFLGWNPGTEQEIFALPELIKAFSLEHIGKAGAKFDIHKAQWFNQQYLRAKSNEELSHYLLDSLKKENISCSSEMAIKVCAVLKERVTFPADFWNLGKFFFLAPQVFDEQTVAKKWNEDATRVLQGFRDEVKEAKELSAESFKVRLEAVTSRMGMATGKILQALRVSLTGGASGPDLMMTMEILGPGEVSNRIDYALKTLRVNVAS
jgi:glutamyl-tRNA synthetase